MQPRHVTPQPIWTESMETDPPINALDGEPELL
jgi:hypothetical protein